VLLKEREKVGLDLIQGVNELISVRRREALKYFLTHRSKTNAHGLDDLDAIFGQMDSA